MGWWGSDDGRERFGMLKGKSGREELEDVDVMVTGARDVETLRAFASFCKLLEAFVALPVAQLKLWCLFVQNFSKTFFNYSTF